MESDNDHLHYLLEMPPSISVSKAVNSLKAYTTFHIWKEYSAFLKKRFWKEKTFWSDGYFAASVGEVSEATLKEYIETQGK